MIPLARMMKYGNTVEADVIFGIDYSTLDIGSTGLPDEGGTPFIARGSGTPGAVVYDSDVGTNVLDCSTNAGFYRTSEQVVGTKLDLSQYDEFEVKYRMRCPATGIQTMFETGNYNTRRILGLVNSFNQYSNAYNQLFIDYGANYDRILPTWANTNTWDTITMTFTKGVSIVVHSELNNQSLTFPWYNIVSQVGQYFSFLGSYVDGDNGGNPVVFRGRIQYIKIRKL